MKKIILAFLAFLLAIPTFSFAQHRVRGHSRDTNRDGIKEKWINPYQRTNPNQNRMDNYNFPRNYNPNKGKFTPDSNSPRQNYPSNPSPYNQRRR